MQPRAIESLSRTPLSAAVIGCGAISLQHLSFLSASPLARIAAVCDTSEASATFACESYQADGWFTNVSEMLSATRPDVVHVLTPPHTHVSLVELCLNAGAHVICEKPLAPNSVDAARLLEHAAALGKVLFESRNLLYNDAIRSIDELMMAGRLGRVLEIEILLSLDLAAGPFGDLNLTRPATGLPGGAVHDHLPHLAYLFLHFANTDGPVEDLTGWMRNASGNPRVGFDYLDALLWMGGRRGRLHISSDTRPDSFRVHVRGDGGSVETDLYNPYLRYRSATDIGKVAPFEQVRSGAGLAIAGLRNLRDKVLQHGTYHGMPRMLSAVYEALITGDRAPADAEQLLATAQLVDRLLELRR